MSDGTQEADDGFGDGYFCVPPGGHLETSEDLSLGAKALAEFCLPPPEWVVSHRVFDGNPSGDNEWIERLGAAISDSSGGRVRLERVTDIEYATCFPEVQPPAACLKLVGAENVQYFILGPYRHYVEFVP